MSAFSRYLRDQRGGIATILALAAVAVFGAVALAVDSAQVYAARSAIKGAADAAALAAVSQDAKDLGKKERRQLAKMYFRANCGDACGDVKTLKVRFMDGGNTVKIIAKSTLSTSLGGTLGVESMRADVESIASMSQGYAEVYLALDNSESMNIPNTDADIQRFIDTLDEALGANTWAGKGCMFACHGTSNGADVTPDGRSFYELARDNDIVLRQDVVRESAMELVRTFQQNSTAGQVSVGVATFSVLTEVKQPATNDLDQVLTTLNGLTVAENYTDLNQMTDALKDIVGEGGDGSSADNPAKILFLVTDGVLNISAQVHGTIDPSECETIKQSGDVKIMVLHLIYGDIERFHPNAGVEHKVVPYTQDRFDNLAACASPGLYFEANQGDSIPQAFEQIAKSIIALSPRLIQ